MLSDILRWGGKRPGQPDPPGDAPAARGGDTLVPSKALPKFLSAIAHQSESPVLIDLGPVIGSNVSFFGEQLGCKLFIEDLFADYDRHSRAGTLDDMATAMDKRFRHEDGSVDGILCWDVFDYLAEGDVAGARETDCSHAASRRLGDGLFLQYRRPGESALHEVQNRR